MKIVWTRRYLRELASIGDYIGQHNPRAATRVVNDIHTRTQRLLSTNAFIGRSGEIKGTRELVIPERPTSLPIALGMRRSKSSSCSTERANGRKQIDPGLMFRATF